MVSRCVHARYIGLVVVTIVPNIIYFSLVPASAFLPFALQDDVKLVARHILLSGDSARSRSTSKAATNGAASSNDAVALQNVLDWLFTAVPDALKMTRTGRGDDTSFNLYLVDHSSQELWTLMPGSGNGNVRAPRKRASIKNGLTGFCARTLQRLVVEDAQVRCSFQSASFLPRMHSSRSCSYPSACCVALMKQL